MASVNPARLLGMETGSLAPVRRTVVAGETV